jgi:adenylate cyclase
VPIPKLAAAAREFGHVTMIADRDGTTRWEALVFEYRGYYYPSLAVQAVRMARGIEASALKLDFGRAFDVGTTEVPLDPRDRMLIDYAGPAEMFRYFSAADVIAGRIPKEALRDRIVFVGGTAAGIYDLRVTPMTPVLPGVEKHANVAANILDQRFLRRPDWVELLETLGILFWPVLLAWLLPKLRPVVSVGSVVLLWGAFFGLVHLVFLRGLWLPLVYPSLAMGLTFVGITVYRLFTEERQRLWIKRAFQRFVSPEVVERLVENPAALQFGGELRNLTVFFSDIRDFTTYTERHPPQEVVHMLREYLTKMTEQVLINQGTVDKFIGDAVMAIFGAPAPLPDHAERACRTALAMAAELETLQTKWAAEGREPFRMGIGINTGEMVVGNLGSEQLFDYTVVGDGVNLGARLESLNKEYQTKLHIIISESTYEAAKDVLEVRHLGEVLVKGKTKPVVIYELQGMKDDGQRAGRLTDVR